jgi:predicted acetyltransferase/RimJ/RimL family protein N-acetyltransferase
MNITFEKASHQHHEAIFTWLEEPHVKEHWDNSQEHKDDIIKFMSNRIEPSDYADGLYDYYVGLINDEPYSMVMIIKETSASDLPSIKMNHISKIGSTYSIDFMIGNKDYLGKNLGAKTLECFIDFISCEIDPLADTFFIDPDVTNLRAKHVYEKAGFKYIDDFIMEGNGVFQGKKTHFLIKNIDCQINILQASFTDYPVIQNMAKYYVYDRSYYMGWQCQSDGEFQCIDFKDYFENPDKKAFLVKVKNELAGFILLDKENILDTVDWNMGEFFILAKFQKKNIGSYITDKIFELFPGKWTISVMPENIKAVNFWRKAISKATTEKFNEVYKTAKELKNEANPDPYAMIIFTFNV